MTACRRQKDNRELWWTRKKSKNAFFRHSDGSRNPVNSIRSGYRIGPPPNRA